ncbi:ABC transporter substrate-binding protein [Nitratidesulfovibrio sp. HK-II]|nr:ABC-type branched-chain amino acid transport systems [Nitratidesulfovibrio sp. HK-II]
MGMAHAAMKHQPHRVTVACTVLLLSLLLAGAAAAADAACMPGAGQDVDAPGQAVSVQPGAQPAPPAQPSLSAQSALAPGAPVRLGMSASFTGPGASLGRAFHRGAASCLAQVNAEGGVHGRRVEIVALDDGYDPERTVWNVIRLIEDERVFALFGLVGTPTVTRVLPLIGAHPDRAVPLLFPFTGARPLYLPRHAGLVFRLRAPYDREFSALVERLRGAGCARIAVFYQADAYGREGWADLRDALACHCLALTAEASYPRGAGSEADFSEQAGLILEGRPDAVVCVGTDAACATFIRDLRDLSASLPPGPAIPVAMPSFVDSRHLLGLLADLGHAARRDYTKDLVMVEVVPPWDGNLPAAVDFRRDMTRLAKAGYAPPAPLASAEGAASTAGIPDEVSFEGYLAARLVVRALERMGQDPDPAGLPAALAGLDGCDLGVGLPYRHTPAMQGLGLVRFTTVRGGAVVELSDFAELRR